MPPRRRTCAAGGMERLLAYSSVVGYGRSEVVGLTLDQLQEREGRWVIVDLIGKGRRLRTVPVPSWSKQLLDAWLSNSGVSEGQVFRRGSKFGKRQQAG